MGLPTFEFSRAWPLLEKVFRPAGPFDSPGKFSNTIVPSINPLRWAFSVGQLRGGRSELALSAGTNVQTLAEPPAGFVQMPIAFAIRNPDAAARHVDVTILNTSSAGDSWGRWNAPSPGLIIDSNNNMPVSNAWYRFRMIPIPRGNQIVVNWYAMTGSNNGQIDYVWIDVPGELVTLDDILKAL